MKVVYALLVLAVIKCIVIYKVYHSLPALEIKRRARVNDKRAAALHRVSAYGRSVDVLLWLAGTSSAAVLIIWSARTNWWLPAAAMAVIAWLLVWAKFPASGWAGRVAAFAAPAYSHVFYYADPVLRWLARFFPSNISLHTGLYEKKDLLEILTRQNKQVDNRIPPADLKIAANAIEFGDKTVGSVMTPRRQIKLVKIDDAIGPMLMDELHKSGFSRFPVVKDSTKSAAPEVVGTLYLNNLVGYEGGGKVRDLMRKEVYYINEDSSLRQALNAFLKTHHHLLVVVNSFEEMAGVLSLEDVLEKILGRQITDEFDSYDDLRAVAAKEARAEHNNHNAHMVAPQE
jgi:CBS domain containing-hemolysin-like protein